MRASSTQNEQERKFFNSLTDFLINSSRLKHNQKDKFENISKDVYPLRLYKLVCRRGGFQAVTNRKQWAQIALELYSKDLLKLKQFYYQYLYPYEQKYYFGKQSDDDFPNMICGHSRKMIKTQTKQVPPPQNSTQPQANQLSPLPTSSKPSQSELVNLKEQITKKFQQQQHQFNTFFLNKNKLNQTKAQTKKIILGLESFMDRKDVIYSLNMLLLYSVNTHSPFIFENNEKIFASLSMYTHSIYPHTNQEALQDLRAITLIFRNFTLNPGNLKYMLGSPLFQLFVRIFNQGLDRECSRNVIDIMTGLVKVGWDCGRIVKNLESAVIEQQSQTIKNSVQLLRGLIDERDQALIMIVGQNLRTLTRILMMPGCIQVKEQVLQILAFVTDASPQAREQVAKDFCLLGIVVGILQQADGSQEKLTQLAALTLNTLSTAMSGKTLIKEFEAELVAIGFSDDSLAGIIANILADIATL